MNNLSDGLKPAGYDKEGPYFKSSDTAVMVVKQITIGTYFNNRSKKMSNDIKNAEMLLDQSTASVEAACARLLKSENKLAEGSKKVSGSVRSSAEKLSAGLARIEKLANFDRLERYVDLLERAEKAMSILAELDQNGKLEKIADALR